VSDISPNWLLKTRQAGVLLHPTSLPGPGRQGDIGPAAYRFIDFLAEAGCRVWQMLPLNPVHDDLSPYRPLSSHAGHTGLISAELLCEQGLFERKDVPTVENDELPERNALVARAWAAFYADASASQRAHFEQFVHEQASWLTDYALFRAAGANHPYQPWYQWPGDLRDRHPRTLEALQKDTAPFISQQYFGQYLFFQQWQSLRDYAHAKGIILFGDLPIYVADDSADVWCHREYFNVDESGQPALVAGVPPDAFSDSGQRWGNPLYRWDRLDADGYRWWVDRFRAQYALFDLLRIDHFRGLESYWAIPGDAPTARDGYWVPGPGTALFDAVTEALGPLPLIAEDLGDITPEVEGLRRHLGLPGMRVLQFGFEGGKDNPHRPENHSEDSVVYTGTHDNNTTLGWWEALPHANQGSILAQLGHPDAAGMPRALIEAASASVGRLSMFPMQDLLGLGAEGRMNTPGIAHGNWQWRMSEQNLYGGPPDWLRPMLEAGGRLSNDT